MFLGAKKDAASAGSFLILARKGFSLYTVMAYLFKKHYKE
jgi:hypothetical protein